MKKKEMIKLLEKIYNSTVSVTVDGVKGSSIMCVIEREELKEYIDKIKKRMEK